MGCATDAYCVTCRKRWYCGHGSYGRNEDRAANSPIAEHKSQGHEVGWTVDEFTTRIGNDLHLEDYFGDGRAEDTLLVKDYFVFEDLPIEAEDPPERS